MNGIHMSPAHDYISASEFECILDDIDKGHIPSGTGQTFPVIWPSDFKIDADNVNLYEFERMVKEKAGWL
jgi:hypothetical protein